MALQSNRYADVLLGRLTLGVFAVTGALVALSEWGILPRQALLVGAPAIVAALLLDTFLYNEFLIGAGRATQWLWVEIYAFLYVQAAVVGAIASALGAHWSEPIDG